MTKQIFKINNASGFAPLIVSIVIVTILSLFTVGFVLLMKNNTSNALNDQLNNGAFYAAESGVNDAIKALNNGYDQVKSSCGPDSSNPYLSNNKVENNGQDYYSCLLINPTPSNLQYSSVGTNSSTDTILTGINPANGQITQIDYLEISWQAPQAMGIVTYNFPNNFPSCLSSSSCFPSEGSWLSNTPGVIRFLLTPMSNVGPRRPENIPNTTFNSYTAFLYPGSSGLSSSESRSRPGPPPPPLPSFGSGASSATPTTYSINTGPKAGEILSGNCKNNNSQPEDCNVILDISNARANSFILSMRSIYEPTTVTITAYSSKGSILDIKNAQTIIDSTGDDQGVLKRIQVRVPYLVKDLGMPSYNLQSSNSICSNLTAYPSNQDTNQKGSASSSCGL
jgi:Tfp pilus assembly protein PilX